jgi:hypothetical protein
MFFVCSGFMLVILQITLLPYGTFLLVMAERLLRVQPSMRN